MRLLKLVPDDTNFDFMRWRNLALVLSLLITIGSVALVAVRGLNLGVDFVGGQQIRATFDRPAPIKDVEHLVEGLGFGTPSIQEFGDPKTISVRMALPKEGGEEAAALAAGKARVAIQQRYPTAKLDVEAVSGKVSDELYRNGAKAIVLSMIGIALYIWFRFEWQFGVGALLTLLHDVCMVFGFFSLTQLEFDLNVVAAILTIVGYSLNDTVVIYDRIRENLRKFRRMEIVPLLNLSLNETLSRTMVTSLSILMALLVLVLVGPEVIFGLSIAILLGIFIGTYSSIYISSPILVWLKVSTDSFLAKAPTVAEQRRAEQTEGYER